MNTIKTFKVKTKVRKNHQIQIENVPFQDGDTVEITINNVKEDNSSKYRLRGTKYKYDNPFEPVVHPDEWEVINDID